MKTSNSIEVMDSIDASVWCPFLYTFILISKGKRWKNRNRKKEEHRGSEESTLSAKDLCQQLQAEKRLIKEEIYPVKKVWSSECTSF